MAAQVISVFLFSLLAVSSCAILAVEAKQSIVPSSLNCTEDYVTDYLSNWLSPAFGESNYQNNGYCTISKSYSAPSWALLTLNTFQLESETAIGTCFDGVTFSRPNTFGDLTLCGDRKGQQYKLPSFNFYATFTNDYAITGKGFNITIEPKSSNCHKVINLSKVGSKKLLKPPRKSNNTWAKKACEWWIRSAPGTKIQIVFKRMKLSSNCSKNSVIVNRYGDPAYPMGNSRRYCGTKRPPKVTSTSNKMNIMFHADQAKMKFIALAKAVKA